LLRTDFQADSSLRSESHISDLQGASPPSPLFEDGLAQDALKRKVGDKGVFSYREQTYLACRRLTGEYMEIRPEAAGDVLYYANIRIASLKSLKV
jgi:hypothetical protein